MENIYKDIISLQKSSTESLDCIRGFPDLIKYGHIFVATIVVDNQVYTETFKYNPSHYCNENMDDVLKRLVAQSGIIDGKLSIVECTEGTLDYILMPEEDNYSRRYSNGVSVSTDCMHAQIPGSAIRYIADEPTNKVRYYSHNWKKLDDSILITINAVAEWKDTSVDIKNKNIINEWLVSSATHVSKAFEYIKQLDSILQKAISEK